jgi:SulP family sulfate permease
MNRVNHCDISGIHMLETVVRLYHQNGGDVFFVGVRNKVLERMELSGFIGLIGRENILSSDDAIAHIFYKILSPAVCVYQCQLRVWKECQSLPKGQKQIILPPEIDIAPTERVPSLLPQELWHFLSNPAELEKMMIIDIREPVEYEQGHLREAKSIPMADFFENGGVEIPRDRDVILICRSGRRSHQLAYYYLLKGYSNVYNLEGGMTALEIAALPKTGQ